MPLQQFDFEVSGTVQGVFFRACTKEKADKLGVVGWCQNTAHGTVKGSAQGPTDKMQTFKTWLRTTGSPQSRITSAEFTNEAEIAEPTHEDTDRHASSSAIEPTNLVLGVKQLKTSSSCHAKRDELCNRLLLKLYNELEVVLLILLVAGTTCASVHAPKMQGSCCSKGRVTLELLKQGSGIAAECLTDTS
eukprot:2202-Heterococcus_DN1.PRE.2